ncbi:MAG: hypothetical protein AB7U61_02450 [Methylocystis sp.]
MKAPNAIAILTYEPAQVDVETYSKLASADYDVFIVIDNNKYEYAGVSTPVTFLKIDDFECINKGFKHLNPVITNRTKRGASAWEKAVYYFTCVDTFYENVWFIEDDVLIPTDNTLRHIDSLYPAADIVSSLNIVRSEYNISGWYWLKHIPIEKLPLPWAFSMVCAVRLSKKVLQAVGDFISRNKDFEIERSRAEEADFCFDNVSWDDFFHTKADTPIKYFFIEYLFHTIALHKNLKVTVAPELQHILAARDRGKVVEIHEECLYHPVKERYLHNLFRRIGKIIDIPEALDRAMLEKQTLERERDELRSELQGLNTDKGRIMDQLSIRETGSAHHDHFTILLQLAFDRALALESEISSDVLALPGMSGSRYRMFINNLVRIVFKPRYLEIGSWMGSTACSAIERNIVSALCIDNWSQFGGPRETFLANIKNVIDDRVTFNFIESDFRSVNVAEIGHYNIYLFDGPHEEKDQYDGLVLYEPALDDDLFFIVDDWNWAPVRSGTLDAVRDAGFNIDFAIEIRTTQNNEHAQTCGEKSDWHNGYFLSKLSRRTRRR